MESSALVLVEDGQHPRPAELMKLTRKALEPLVSHVVLRDVLLALDEAYSNVLEHSYKGKKPQHLRILAQVATDSLLIIIQDHGPFGSQLNFSSLHESSTQDLYRKVISTGGNLGLHFIRKTMNRLCYEVSPQRGNQLYLKKTLDKEQILEDELIIESSVNETIAVFVIKGSLNIDTSDFLMQRVQDFSQKEGLKRFLFHMDGVDFIASAGISAFINLYDSYESQNGRIAFLNMREDVRHVVNLLGFMAFFGDFQNEEQAFLWLNAEV